MTGFLIKRGHCEDTETWGEQKDAGVGVRYLQAKEHQDLLVSPEAQERGKKKNQILPQSPQNTNEPPTP